MSRRLGIVCALALAALALAPPAQAAKTRSCGLVAFTPQSDDGAFRILATGVSCKTARAVARASRGRGPSGTVGKRYAYRALGFACSGVEVEDGLAAVNYRCKRGAATVSFSKS